MTNVTDGTYGLTGRSNSSNQQRLKPEKATNNFHEMVARQDAFDNPNPPENRPQNSIKAPDPSKDRQQGSDLSEAERDQSDHEKAGQPPEALSNENTETRAWENGNDEKLATTPTAFSPRGSLEVAKAAANATPADQTLEHAPIVAASETDSGHFVHSATEANKGSDSYEQLGLGRPGVTNGADGFQGGPQSAEAATSPTKTNTISLALEGDRAQASSSETSISRAQRNSFGSQLPSNFLSSDAFTATPESLSKQKTLASIAVEADILPSSSQQAGAAKENLPSSLQAAGIGQNPSQRTKETNAGHPALDVLTNEQQPRAIRHGSEPKAASITDKGGDSEISDLSRDAHISQSRPSSASRNPGISQGTDNPFKEQIGAGVFTGNTLKSEYVSHSTRGPGTETLGAQSLHGSAIANQDPRNDTPSSLNGLASNTAIQALELGERSSNFQALEELRDLSTTLSGHDINGNKGRLSTQLANTHIPFGGLEGSASDFRKQITAQWQTLIANSQAGEFKFQLSPEELGRVTYRLSMSDSGISVVISADRQETLDLMRRNFSQLQSDFNGMGFSSTSFSFEGDGSFREDDFEALTLPDGEHQDETQNLNPMLASQSEAGVDIRL